MCYSIRMMTIQDRTLAHRNIASHAMLSTIPETHECTSTFNGIAIPEEVIRQLKMLCNIPISWMNRADIEDAVLNFEGDTQIVEDSNGHTLQDKMNLTWDEITHNLTVVEVNGSYKNNIHIQSDAIEDENNLDNLVLKEDSFVEDYLSSNFKDSLTLAM